LGLTRVKLANSVGCSPITIKKIERDERRPSVQIAELLAEHLQLPNPHKVNFLRKARGKFVESFIPPNLNVNQTPPSKPKSPDRFKILSRLDILPHQKLFGIEENKQTVVEVLNNPNRPWLLSIEGIGGQGKTTLANEIIHHFIQSIRFEDIGWISAKQEEFVTGYGIKSTNNPALTAVSLIDSLLAQLADSPYSLTNEIEKKNTLLRILKEKKCLIVIDNLETIDDYLSLLPILRQLSNPSKFIITSRMSLKNEGDVFCLSLSELDEETTLEFLIYEAQLQNIPPLLQANRMVLQKIYRTTGGNPLAIKLVIGQSNFLPLEQILNNLHQAQEVHVEQLYNYIYWQAWQMLDENGRKLFMSLPIVPNGSFEQLQIASNLSNFELQQSLATLQRLSLVKVKGTVSDPRYNIHRLTESFLMKEVIRWRAKDQIQSQKEIKFFKNQIQAIVSHWQGEPAIQTLNIQKLESEKDAILKALNLGLEIKPAWPMVKELLTSLSSYMERRGYWDTWQKVVSSAILKAREYQDLEGELSLTTLKGRVFQRQNNIPEVIRNYQKVIRLARKANNLIEEGRACTNLGFTFCQKGQHYRSKVLLCHALDLFDKTDYRHGQAHTHNHLGILYQEMKLTENAEAHYQRACHIWEDSNDQHGLVYGLINLGALFNDLEQPRSAIGYLSKALRIAEQTGEIGEAASINLNLGVAFENANEVDQAEKHLADAEAQYKSFDFPLGVYKSWETLGKVYKKKDQQELAQTYFESALEGFVDIGDEEGRLRVESLMDE
ncbi:MAG: tetratricopeptide repeat protein, partial [Chloroflexota bacterium]